MSIRVMRQVLKILQFGSRNRTEAMKDAIFILQVELACIDRERAKRREKK